MANFRILLGLVPSTEKIEAKHKLLSDELSRLNSISNSEQLSRYNELKEIVGSQEFLSKRKEIENSKFSQTEDYQKEKKYNSLVKNKAIKQYYKSIEEGTIDRFHKIEDSKELKKFNELSEYVQSEEFNKEKAYYKLSAKKRFQQSDAYHLLEEFDKIKGDSKVKGYFKFILNKAFNDFKVISDSDKPELFESLSAEIVSDAFKSKVKLLKKEKTLTGSEEQGKIEQFKVLKKDTQLKNFLKLKNSSLFSVYSEMDGSDIINAYHELDKQIKSQDFLNSKTEIEKAKFADSESYKKLQELESLSKSNDLVFYNKFKNSKELKNYNELHESETIKEYEELKEFVNSQDFKDRKAYMLLKGKDKFKQSDIGQQFDEYIELSKSDDILFYHKNIDSKKYDELKQWKLTFEEDFDKSKLDTDRWLTKYFWGEALMGQGYNTLGDLHHFNEKNIELSDSIARIVTKRQKIQDITWNPPTSKKPIGGFFQKDFDYTSAVFNSGSSFRQQYGKFEAKIKFNDNYPVSHCFWLVGEKRTPQIDIAKADKGITFNQFWKNGDAKPHKTSLKAGSKYKNDYFIFSLEWSKKKITWKINGVDVGSRIKHIPQEPMYLAFSSALYKEPKEEQLPAQMEIDWVRCYEKVD